MAAASTDPVREGIVTSLARPGGNVTGIVAAPGAGLLGKRLELLKEVMPSLSRVAILGDANVEPYAGSAASKEGEKAAQSLGLQLLPLEARGPQDFDGAVLAAVKERAGGLYVASTPLFSGVRRRPLVEQPTQFELVINLKTAKALGLTIPPSVRLRADHVIE
jgi:putative ABC transport system substrate-binding protein